MPKKKSKTGKPTVHKDLKGFEIDINEFGEIKTNTNIEELNKFLNKHVDDKKLVDRDDLNLTEEETDDEDVELDEETLKKLNDLENE